MPVKPTARGKQSAYAPNATVGPSPSTVVVLDTQTSLMHRIPPWARVVVALVAAAVVAALAWPVDVPRKTTWADLLSPYSQGAPIVRGYRLLPPSRGEEHDIVALARRDAGPDGPAAHVQLHVLDRGRWPGIRETRSFGVAYETPRSSAPEQDRQDVTEAIANALRARDTGFESVDSIALQSEPAPPPLSRSLRRLSGIRGAVCALLSLTALVSLASSRFGPAAVALLLAALGALLRFAHLGLPFVRDQDVQRLMTGYGSWTEVLFGMGLQDRHPPLFFAILHVVQWFGQSEAVVRAPAALAGALIGPAIVYAGWRARGVVDPSTIAAAFAVAVSPELISRSREVSEIPLFGLVAVLAIASTANGRLPVSRARYAAIAASHAILLWLYYLAPVVLAGQWLGLRASSRPHRRVVHAAIAGVLAGLPALVLLLVTISRDYGARRVADRFPGLAWGSRSPTDMLREIAHLTVEAFGLPLLLVWTAVLVVGLARSRARGAMAALGAVTAALAGLALATIFARVQPYYIVAVLPLLPLSVALLPNDWPPRLSLARHATVIAATVAFASARGPSAAALYMPSAEAFMPAFASIISARPERQVAVIPHYDATLLHYYLCRLAGVPAEWRAVGDNNAFYSNATGKTVRPLAMAHALTGHSGQVAATALVDAMRQGPVLVVDRFSFQLPEVAALLERCEVLDNAPVARLLVCRDVPQQQRGDATNE